MSVQGLFGGSVVVGIDLSDDWGNTLAHAIQMAELSGSKLHIVHVNEAPSSSLTRLLDGEELQKAIESGRQHAAERLEAAHQRIPESFRGDTVVREGQPAEEILAAAKDLDGGLIVVGAGVIEGSEHLVIGTTPDRLVRSSKVPVLVVGLKAPHGYQHVVVPTDLDKADEGAIRIGCRIASAKGGKAEIFHSYSIPSLLHRYMGNVASLREKARENAEAAFHSYVDGVELGEGCTEPQRVLIAESDETHPAEVIISEAHARNADLIVMALGGITIFQRWFIGGVAEQILRALPCTLLALPTAWAEKH